tara:strand:+ start:44 stop:439 length:396 start_codon:yes stop_codon:yes gene_type:complete
MVLGAHHIVIIGAGIVGASIAHRLSRTNVNVTVIDALEGPGLGVSAASFGWITCSAGTPDLPELVYQSRLAAIDDYGRLTRSSVARSARRLKERWYGVRMKLNCLIGRSGMKPEVAWCGWSPEQNLPRWSR